MSVSAYSRRYAEMGLALTWSPFGHKGPRHHGWNDPANAITDPEKAAQYWTQNPEHGIGVLLAPSGLVSLDVDHVEHTRDVLGSFNIDLDRIEAPRIVGNPARFRLIFRAPKTELRHRTLSWPQQYDPRKSFALFELRAGNISDALPPTRHVGTGGRYTWGVPPTAGFPELPMPLLDLWIDWQDLEPVMRSLCPWAPPPPQPSAKAIRREPVSPQDSVIAQFNDAYDPAAILEAHGYRRMGNRFASPDTSHAAGIVLLDGGRVYCHHAGDILGGGKALDAFDLYARLNHNGNVREAVKSAAKTMGMDRRVA